MYGFTDGIDALHRTGRPIGSEVFAYDGLNRLRQFTTTGTDCAAASNGAAHLPPRVPTEIRQRRDLVAI